MVSCQYRRRGGSVDEVLATKMWGPEFESLTLSNSCGCGRPPIVSAFGKWRQMMSRASVWRHMMLLYSLHPSHTFADTFMSTVNMWIDTTHFCTSHTCTLVPMKILVEYGTVSRYWKHLKASEIVQWVKMFGAKSDNVSLSRTHIVEGENWLPLWVPKPNEGQPISQGAQQESDCLLPDWAYSTP